MFYFIFPLFTAGIYPCHSSLAHTFQLSVLLTWVTNCSIFASMATVIDCARWDFLIEFCSSRNTKSIRAGTSLSGLCPVPGRKGQTGSRSTPIYTTAHLALVSTLQRQMINFGYFHNRVRIHLSHY